MRLLQGRRRPVSVDHILNRGKKLDVPPDLEWCRLPDLHAAVLGAHQVRCDFAIALHGLWIKVWQHALDHCGFADSLEPQSLYERQQEGYAYPCDTYSLWDSGILERVYDAGDHKIGLGVCVATKQVWLAIWLLDGQESDLTVNLTLGDDWVSAWMTWDTSGATMNLRGSRTTAAASRSTRSTGRRDRHWNRSGGALARQPVTGGTRGRRDGGDVHGGRLCDPIGPVVETGCGGPDLGPGPPHRTDPPGDDLPTGGEGETIGTDQNQGIHLYTCEWHRPEARSARGRCVQRGEGAPAPAGYASAGEGG